MNDDAASIHALVARFFAAFDNRRGAPDLGSLRELCIPECVIVKAVGATPEVYGLESFIAPRLKILTDGTLTDFFETELTERTIVFGNAAQRLSSYRKSGMLHGVRFSTDGTKMLQFVKMPSGWRISAVLWDDEPTRGS